MYKSSCACEEQHQTTCTISLYLKTHFSLPPSLPPSLLPSFPPSSPRSFTLSSPPYLPPSPPPSFPLCLTSGDGVSISVASNTMSENTNNITTASVNELFSNSSLLRMNAIIPESASTCAVPVQGEGKRVGGDSASRMCVEVSWEVGEGGGG